MGGQHGQNENVTDSKSGKEPNTNIESYDIFLRESKIDTEAYDL